ncbi:MAG: helix-turn-helix domain-containing protein [Streptococcaceae bacterium]|nr:helix-turn-helix domain-containing protein [Streptococcaceae bacterium]
MEINKIFFNDLEIDRLNVGIFLAKNKGQLLNITQLAHKFHFTYNQMARILTRIEEDFRKFDFDEGMLTIANGTIFIHKDFPCSSEYRIKLINQSVVYKFLVSLLKKKEQLFEDFLEENKISRATFYRKISQLTTFAKKFNIRFPQQANQPLQIIGKEFGIRTFFFFLLWTIGNETIWPFEIAQSDALELVCAYTKENKRKITLSFQFQLSFLFAIMIQRAQQNKSFTTKNQEELSQLLKENIPIFLPTEFPLNEIEVLNKENTYLRLVWLMYNFSISDLEKGCISFLPRLNPTHNITLASSFLFKQLSKNNLCNKEKESEVKEMIYYLSFLQYFIDDSIISMESLGYKHISNKFTHTQNEIKHILEDYHYRLESYFGPINLHSFSHRLTTRLERYVNDMVQRQTSVKFSVGLAIESAHPYHPKIRQALELLPNVVTKNIYQADESFDFAIVTNPRLTSCFGKTPQFHWEQHFTEAEIPTLIHNIQDSILKKTHNYKS